MNLGSGGHGNQTQFCVVCLLQGRGLSVTFSRFLKEPLTLKKAEIHSLLNTSLLLCSFLLPALILHSTFFN